MRKLASIQTVNAVEPIPNADAIERLRILGWWVVSKKGEYAVGDRVIYCEVDSLLPERPEFEFLRASSFKPAQLDESGAIIQPAGFRIRTARLRGQISQGLCLPLTFLPSEVPTTEGTDVTSVLGILKWEPPLPIGMSGKVRGPFPSFLPKTDETRVQVLTTLLSRHRGKRFYLTEKLDGTSFTAFVNQDSFGICSRNMWIDETDDTNILVRTARRLQLEERLHAVRARLGFDIAVQAELIGPGIQKNKYALSETALRVFSVLNVQTRGLLDHATSLDIITQLGLEPVPHLGTLILDHTVDDLVALAEGTSQLNPKVHREGIVFRPHSEEYDEELGGRLSFKAINPKFLLKYDE